MVYIYDGWESIWIEDVRTLSVYIKYYLLNCAGAAACPCEMRKREVSEIK